MPTECQEESLSFQGLGRREVIGRFDGGAITSDGGALLLREVECAAGILSRFARGFIDHRNPALIEHTAEELIRQRVFGLCLGYEDLNDHDDLRHDPMLAVLVGKSDPTGQDRICERDRGKALAGKSTLNRLELTPARANAKSRYQKIVARHSELEQTFVEVFLEQHATPPKEIVLDLDATDDPIHGQQLGGFFQGYYREYCFLPLYIFCGHFPLCAKLRPADIDASAGSLKQVQRLVTRIRQSWPEVVITLRADSGFCRENLMAWCEANGVRYVFGLPKNKRLLRIIGRELHEAKLAFEQSGEASRVFSDFTYRTQKSWSATRRVVGKAEHLSKGANPRFVVTNVPMTERAAQPLYEQDYCARGEMENRIKEQQLCLFADRTSCETLRANQLRLWFSTVAYVIMHVLRERGLKETPLAAAQCDTIRLKLLKIGAAVAISVRKVWIHLSSGSPYRELFFRVFHNLRQWASARPPSAMNSAVVLSATG